MAQDAFEKRDCSLSLDIITTQAQMHECSITALQHSCQLLEPCIRETVLTEVQLCKLRVILDDLADNMHRLVTQGHLSEVQLSSAHLSMVLHDDVEEALHLLLRGVDNQVLALSHV